MSQRQKAASPVMPREDDTDHRLAIECAPTYPRAPIASLRILLALQPLTEALAEAWPRQPRGTRKPNRSQR